MNSKREGVHYSRRRSELPGGPAIWLVAGLAVSLSMWACGGSATPTAEATTPENEARAGDADSTQPEADTGAGATQSAPDTQASQPEKAAQSADTTPHEGPARQEGSTAAEPNTASSPAAEAARNVKYVVSPEGLRVEVDGVSFTPKGEAVKAGGGYSIRLKVDARAKDGKTHSILAPEGRELAFAGTVKTQGEATRFGDKREGDRALTLGQKPLTLKRTFPDAGQKPLALGDELELMVGLWGLGFDESSRRPLNKFFRVTVKLDKEKPRVVIGPPEGTPKE